MCWVVPPSVGGATHTHSLSPACTYTHPCPHTHTSHLPTFTLAHAEDVSQAREHKREISKESRATLKLQKFLPHAGKQLHVAKVSGHLNVKLINVMSSEPLAPSTAAQHAVTSSVCVAEAKDLRYRRERGQLSLDSATQPQPAPTARVSTQPSGPGMQTSSRFAMPRHTLGPSAGWAPLTGADILRLRDSGQPPPSVAVLDATLKALKLSTVGNKEQKWKRVLARAPEAGKSVHLLLALDCAVTAMVFGTNDVRHCCRRDHLPRRHNALSGP